MSPKERQRADSEHGTPRPLRHLWALRTTSEPLGGPNRLTHCSFHGCHEYSHRCHLLDSGESLSGLCTAARYPVIAGMSANESLESVGALRGT